MKTYKNFVEQFGKRPPDIVFAITQREILSQVREEIKKIDNPYPASWGAHEVFREVRNLILKALEEK
jgi:hypothetical protein